MSPQSIAGAETAQAEDSGYIPKEQPLVIVISGPSGAGKDSVIQRLRERALDFHFVVTATDRPARENEVHGVDYWFYSKEAFERMIADDELLENALVYGQHKGVPRAQVREALASGKDVIMRLDVQGAQTVKAKVPGAILIFITGESRDGMIARLENRKTESAEQLKLRLETARQEFEQLGDFHYVVVNPEGDLDGAVDDILAIIRAEHKRVEPRRVNL
jgi:guanylate kinase